MWREIINNIYDSQKYFIYWVLTLIDQKYKYEVEIIHRNLAIILRIMNSSEKIDTIKLEVFCKDTYEFIIISFPWANYHNSNFTQVTCTSSGVNKRS